jgi:hypothetical protein
MLGPSSLHQANVAFEPVAWCYQTLCAQLCMDATHWAFHLEDMFLAAEQGSGPFSPLSPAVAVGEQELYLSEGMDTQL